MTTTTDSSAPNGVSRTDLEATRTAVRAAPELAQVTFGINSTWQSGCHQLATTTDVIQHGEPVRTTRYSLASDEPTALLGSDHAASPGEFILHALAGCYAATFAAQATLRGITLTGLRLDLEADFDLQGFLGTNPSVRPGAQDIRVVAHVTAPDTSDEEVEELVRSVEAHSPIRDTLANPVTVTTLTAD